MENGRPRGPDFTKPVLSDVCFLWNQPLLINFVQWNTEKKCDDVQGLNNGQWHGLDPKLDNILQSDQLFYLAYEHVLNW